MSRIAVGGWQHETNTFATLKADYDSFKSADEWPALHLGQEMLDSVRNVHLPIAGALKALEEHNNEIVPLLWCSATPCSLVTEEAFEIICNDMLQILEQSLPVDAIYFDLHGAMVCEHVQDGEGEFLQRVRNLVGNDLPIYVSLDLHANVTPLMVEHASVLDIYRTYPHIDMAETGYRVSTLLHETLNTGIILKKSFRKIDFLIPLNSGCTLIEPCNTIYDALGSLVSDNVTALSFACGFHLSDIFDVGPAVVAYGVTQKDTDQAVNKLSEIIYSNKQNFYEKIWPVDEGIIEAKREFEKIGRTVVIADTQDNPGGGGAGDTTGVIQAMINHKLENAVVGVINDAEVADQAHQLGIGGKFVAKLGNKVVSTDSQFQPEIEIRNLSDGKFTGTGPMYKGANMEIGLTALLEISGIQVVVCSKSVQTADQAHFRHIGVEPDQLDFIALKSSVHFRNDFSSLASKILIISAPGEVFADPATLQYKNIRPNIEITSMG